MAHASALNPDYRGQRRSHGLEPPSPDLRMIEFASRRHGVVSRAELSDLGLTRRAIEHRLENGRLHSVYRGIYAVGRPDVSREGRWMAAVLAAGPGAVLSHLSAATHWGIWPYGAVHAEVT